MVDLRTLGRAGYSYAVAVTDHGQVVGYSSLADGPDVHAVIWRTSPTP
jgi:hypothetical protein